MINTTFSGKKKFNLYLLPLMFILGILPFISRLKLYDPEMQFTGFVGMESEYSDIYLYYRHWFFVIIAAIMVCLIILQCFTKNRPIKFKKLFIPLCAYALLVVLSSLLSDYSHFSLTGGHEQFQSMWALLGYTLLAYYGFIFVSEVKDVKILMTVVTISTVLMMIIGLSQAFGHDLIRSDFAYKLLIPRNIREQGGTLSFPFGEKTVYLTLYNPNYVGSYVSLLSPIFLMLIFTKKNIGNIILNAGLYVALLLSLLGSGSRAGLIGIIASLLILAFIFGKKILKYWSEIILVLVLIIGTIYTMNNYSNNSISNRFKASLDIEKTEYNLTSIETDTDSVKITYKGHDINLNILDIDQATESVSFTITDENGFQIATEPADEISFNITDERFSKIKLTLTALPLDANSKLYGVTFKIDNKDWTFIKVNGSMNYFTHTSYLVPMADAEMSGPFVDYPKLLSGRGYIWSSTIPLLKDNIFLGTGPDTFLLYFPNYDYLARYNNGFENEIITKPHNMYLQIAVETGMLSLICFLVFYFWYFISSVICIRRSDISDYLTLVNIGILSGSFGYMVVGLINDSMIVVAPLFWALIGIGIGINTILTNKYGKNSSLLISDVEAIPARNETGAVPVK